MKKSSFVGLVLSGALLSACNSSDDGASWEDSQVYTNNHYIAGRGYYHAPYRAWYPLPYNDYDAQRRAYFHGGQYTAEPHASSVTASRPVVRATTSHSSSTRRGGFVSSRSSSGIS